MTLLDHRANFIHYPLQFVAALALRDQNYTCSPNFADGQLMPVPAGYSTCAIPNNLPAGYKCQVQCGKDILETFGVFYNDAWIVYNFLCLLGFALGLFVIGYLGTKFVQHVNR
jgi:hypothetical protein